MDTQEREEAQASAVLLRQRSLRRAGHICDASPDQNKHQRGPSSPKNCPAYEDFLPLVLSPPPPFLSQTSPTSPSPSSLTSSPTTPFGNRIGQTVGGALRRIQQASKILNFNKPSSWVSKDRPTSLASDARRVGLDNQGLETPVPSTSRESQDTRLDSADDQSRYKRKPVTCSHAWSWSNISTSPHSSPPPPDLIGASTHTVTRQSLSGVEELGLTLGLPTMELDFPHECQHPTQTRHAFRDSTPTTSERSNSVGSSVSTAMGDVHVPPLLKEGTQMTRVTSKKRKKVIVWLNPDMGQIVWEVMQPLVRQRIIPIENIKEMRSGPDARYYREQFQLAQAHEDCWLTIIYILDGNYKTLHLIAPTVDIFRMWDTTLRKLYAIRQELMSGLGNYEMRQALWEKQYWKGSNLEANERLRFGEVERLCRRMNIHSNSESLLRLFKQADVKSRGYLDFEDFRRFVKLLRGRPELDRLYKKLIHSSRNSGKNGKNGAGILGISPLLSNNDVFDFKTFEYFMREKQGARLGNTELKRLFNKYATVDGEPVSALTPPASSPPSRSASPTRSEKKPTKHARIPTMTLDAFTSFLMSADNSAFLDQHGNASHDMMRPLSDYFVSSSHNTYLVGHQLVGVSTIEGYIRALLHSCRSVEVDIYDGDVEPMIFHGKTFTSKVSLREVCRAIMKYGFVASPYPIIISAEVHCSLPQQDMVAEIMVKVFGDALVKFPPSSKQKPEALPSPEDLKWKILFKTKDVTAFQDSSDSDVFTETSGTSSASDSDALQEFVDYENKRQMSLTPPMQAAWTVIEKVRHANKSSSLGGGSGSSGSSAGQSISGLTITTSPPQTALDANTDSLLTPLSLTGPTTMVGRRPSTKSASKPKPPKISPTLRSLMVYTVGVKFQGINKKVDYAPEHMFSLSETTANKIIKAGDGTGMHDLIKHCRSHLVRVYPKGLRVNSTNYEPHRYWSAGAQLVAMNWQTFDLGYMINHAMFQRNGRSGYVLKPAALRSAPGHKGLLAKRTSHYLDLNIISAQQLPQPKDSSGKEIIDRPVMDPYVEVTVHVPDWTYSLTRTNGHGEGWLTKRNGEQNGDDTEPPLLSPHTGTGLDADGQIIASGSTTTLSSLSAHSVTYRTSAVKNNGFNPVWEEKIRIPFECVGDMWDLVFVRFVVRRENKEDEDPLAIYCVSLGSLGHGYRHLPLHDAQLSQYLFSTLFVKVDVEDGS